MKRKLVIFRPHDWIDLKRCKPVFGVQARQIGRPGWMHVCDGNSKPLFFTKRRERDREVKRLNRQEAERRVAAKAAAALTKE